MLQLASSDQHSGLCSKFQFESEILALLGVYLHTNTKWVESVYPELEKVDIAALYGGEGETARRVGFC